MYRCLQFTTSHEIQMCHEVHENYELYQNTTWLNFLAIEANFHEFQFMNFPFPFYSCTYLKVYTYLKVVVE